MEQECLKPIQSIILVKDSIMAGVMESQVVSHFMIEPHSRSGSTTHFIAPEHAIAGRHWLSWNALRTTGQSPQSCACNIIIIWITISVELSHFGATPCQVEK